MGRVYHEVTIVDENGRIADDVTSVYIYVPGTTTPATIYSDKSARLEMSQPITATSGNTTLKNGVLKWWGDDLYDYSVSNGTVTTTNFNTDSFSSNNGRIVFLSNLFNGTTEYTRTILDDADEAEFKATVNLEPGTDVQAWNTNLDWLAANITAFSKTIIDDLDQSSAKTTLGLGTSDSPTFAGITIGDESNNLSVNSSGHKTLTGDAIVYDDLQVSISNVKLPASDAPDEVLYNFGIGGGVTFPTLAFAVDEYIYFDVQTTHSMALNTILDNHIHYTLPNTTDIGDKFKFQLDVIAAGVGAQWAVPTGSPFTAEFAVAANDNTYHRLGEIADIPAVNSTVSTIYKCKLTRISASENEYGSDVYINFNDCHYQKDSDGSDEEYVK